MRDEVGRVVTVVPGVLWWIGVQGRTQWCFAWQMPPAEFRALARKAIGTALSRE